MREFARLTRTDAVALSERRIDAREQIRLRASTRGWRISRSSGAGKPTLQLRLHRVAELRRAAVKSAVHIHFASPVLDELHREIHRDRAVRRQLRLCAPSPRAVAVSSSSSSHLRFAGLRGGIVQHRAEQDLVADIREARRRRLEHHRLVDFERAIRAWPNWSRFVCTTAITR